MARDGNGSYSLPESAFVYDTVISETAMNSNLSDLATAMTASLAKDGQTNPSANLPMATYRHTGVGNASGRTDYASAADIQDGSLVWCGTAGGTADVITLTPSPAISAYVTGMKFRWKASSNVNTGAMTINISAVGAKAAELNDAALSGGDHAANKYYEGFYDGTAIQITRVSGPIFSDPITTRGDIIRGSSSGAAERLPLGATGYPLTSDGTDSVFAQLGLAGIAPAAKTEIIAIAASDETTDLTTGTSKVKFRMPYGFTLTGVRGSLSTVATGGTLLTIDINESGSTILSTKLTFDASESTTTTATTEAVIDDAALADDAEITIDIDAIGSTNPGRGLKIYLIGYQT